VRLLGLATWISSKVHLGVDYLGLLVVHRLHFDRLDLFLAVLRILFRLDQAVLQLLVLDIFVFEVFGRGKEQFLYALAALQLFGLAPLLLALRGGTLLLTQLVLDGGNPGIHVLVVGDLLFQFPLVFLFFALLVARLLSVRQQIILVGVLICKKGGLTKELTLFIDGFTFFIGVGYFVSGQQVQNTLVELFGKGKEVILLRGLLLLAVPDVVLLPETLHNLRLGHVGR